MTKPVFITRDIGLAIRDHLEQKCVTHFEERADELEDAGQDEVVAVDVSDPNNIIICLDNGQTFMARIFAGEKPTQQDSDADDIACFECGDNHMVNGVCTSCGAGKAVTP